jgi:hypothetical protein
MLGLQHVNLKKGHNSAMTATLAIAALSHGSEKHAAL